MRTPSPQLLPLLRSQAQGDLLALLYLHPDREYSLTEAAALIDASVKTVHKEASRLVASGFISDSRLGNVRLLRAVTGAVISRPLTDLLAVTYGPLPVLTGLLAGAEGVNAAFIFGSWAARYCGEPGPIPHDVDVLIVGTADRDDLDEIARTAQDRLGRQVNLRRISESSWSTEDSADPFLTSVRQHPLVELPLTEYRKVTE